MAGLCVQMDEYTQKLAESIMRDEDGDDDDDFDDDEFDDDDEEEDGEAGIESADDGADGDEEAAGQPDVDEGSKRRKRKKGPTYADAEDFAHILEDAADEYEGVNPRLADWEQGYRGKRRR